MNRDEERELLLQFLQERQRPLDFSYMDSDLPQPIDPHPTVSFPLPQLTRFHDDYVMVTAFAAHVCGAKVDKFCPMDMMAYLLREREKAD